MFLENIDLMLENNEEMDRLFWDKGQAASAPRSPHEIHRHPRFSSMARQAEKAKR